MGFWLTFQQASAHGGEPPLLKMAEVSRSRQLGGQGPRHAVIGIDGKPGSSATVEAPTPLRKNSPLSIASGDRYEAAGPARNRTLTE